MPAVVSWVENVLDNKEQWTGSRYCYLLRNVAFSRARCDSKDVEAKAQQSLYALQLHVCLFSF